MNITELYDSTILKLKNNQRPQILLTPELISELKDNWLKAIAGPVLLEKELTQVLCILDNTQNSSASFNELFAQTFAKIKSQELLIYTLAASQKHVINQSLKSGEMIPAFYFDELKKLLQNKNPEVLEWTLRTIESMGPLSLRLKKEVRNAMPGLSKFLNRHQKAAAQIIELLEQEWKRML